MNNQILAPLVVAGCVSYWFQSKGAASDGGRLDPVSTPAAAAAPAPTADALAEIERALGPARVGADAQRGRRADGRWRV